MGRPNAGQLSDWQKRLLYYLSDRSKVYDIPSIQISSAELSEVLGTSKRQVQLTLKQLQRRNLLTREVIRNRRGDFDASVWTPLPLDDEGMDRVDRVCRERNVGRAEAVRILWKPSVRSSGDRYDPTIPPI